MPKKTTDKERQFDCSKCGKRTFRLRVTEHYADEGMLLDTTIDEILGDGGCPVNQNAKIPGHGVHTELMECPVYAELEKW